MGRKTTNPVGKLFFNYNFERDESTCNIKGCRRPVLKGRHSHNLETHIKSSHPNECNILEKAKSDLKNQNNVKRSIEDHTMIFPPKKRGPLDNVITISRKNLFIQMNKKSLLDACTEMVTINGRPLTIFNDSGFKKILNPLTRAIGEGFVINSHNIKDHILSASNIIISQIKNDIKNLLISLKIDCVKRHNRSIMGVNIQYIKDVKVCLSTLAMVEIDEQHTAKHLKQMLFEILEKYEISKEQIYTITCDNAANMVKLVKLVNEESDNNSMLIEHDIQTRKLGRRQ